MKEHVNELYFDFDKSDNIDSVSFVYSGEHIVTEGQRFDEVAWHDDHISVTAGRKGSTPCADWFKNYVSGDYVNMVHTVGGENLPSKLNFAFKGRLTINGHGFDVCIGQGHRVETGENNWHIASRSIETDRDGKNAEIGDGIRITQSGTHGFKLATSRVGVQAEPALAGR